MLTVWPRMHAHDSGFPEFVLETTHHPEATLCDPGPDALSLCFVTYYTRIMYNFFSPDEDSDESKRVGL